ncbi:hypothetical protein [Deinococcus puniceus]|uniref:Outer membrane protein beta-barrel domain-containing protein n=1 Tax=Deinococcus puniceus TaxID=1182568 RepID=A0A172T6P7_9DEIO|nr:hypothetical protein [Deinococcus puniceus]ANE42715.1 hypothetical protein SU48_01895 [Deinococcus puniceus]
MKKALIGLALLAAASSASAATYVGGSIGTGLTVHLQNDLDAASAVRYGLNLDAVSLFRGGSLAVGGDVAYLNDIIGQDLGGLSPYYGLGLGAYVSLGSNNEISVYPNGILGLKFQVSDPLSVFVEGSAGPRVSIGGGQTGIGFGFGARIGLNYQLP